MGSAVLTNRRTRQLQVTRNRADALPANQMSAPDFGNHIHEQHPRNSSSKARVYAYRGAGLFNANADVM
jgi:hypothetical protein